MGEERGDQTGRPTHVPRDFQPRCRQVSEDGPAWLPVNDHTHTHTHTQGMPETASHDIPGLPGPGAAAPRPSPRRARPPPRPERHRLAPGHRLAHGRDPNRRRSCCHLLSPWTRSPLHRPPPPRHHCRWPRLLGTRQPRLYQSSRSAEQAVLHRWCCPLCPRLLLSLRRRQSWQEPDGLRPL